MDLQTMFVFFCFPKVACLPKFDSGGNRADDDDFRVGCRRRICLRRTGDQGREDCTDYNGRWVMKHRQIISGVST